MLLLCSIYGVIYYIFVISCGTIIYIVYHRYVDRIKYNFLINQSYKNEKPKRIKYS